MFITYHALRITNQCPQYPLKSFRTYSDLEEHKGFNDAAVAGGLEAFARRWAEQAGQNDRSAKGIAEAIAGAFNSYAFGSVEVRQEAVRRATDLLRDYDLGVRHVSDGKVSSNGHAIIEGFTGFDDEDARAKPPVSSFRSNVSPPPSELPPQPANVRAARRNATLDSPVTVLRGVQDATARLLKRLGVYTVRDALLFFPFRYDDFSAMKPIAELVPDMNQTIVATIWEVEARKTRNGRPLVTATLADDSGTISVSWFNQEYLPEVAAAGRADCHFR